jgi:hypothetical protein
MRLTDLLDPPVECGSSMTMRFRDRRKGGFWFCKHASKIVGQGKSKPACLCKAALDSARSALTEEQG